MKDKVLIFIPYQDEDNFYSDGILTREFAVLYSLVERGYNSVISVKKPRTWLDRKKYSIVSSYYPDGAVENCVKKILDSAVTIQHLPIISISQLIKRRCWWEKGYQNTIKQVDRLLNFEKNEYLIYSDNPFASKMIIHLKELGCKLYFDIMDNFAIHPSLNENERAAALRQYTAIFPYTDIISANSIQTCEFMQEYTDKTILLVKNGVFADNEISGTIELAQIKKIKEEKKKYKKCVGYIGKLGLRLDADLIENVSKALPDILFVFIGDYLRGQINEKLITLFQADNNVLHVDGIPSAYVYSALNEFDILSIPHSVGKNENGGDPLKLYQYLTRRKPVIASPILGVSEFEDYICISNNVDEWIEFIRNTPTLTSFANVEGFTWASRLNSVLKEI